MEKYRVIVEEADEDISDFEEQERQVGTQARVWFPNCPSPFSILLPTSLPSDVGWQRRHQLQVEQGPWW